MFGRDEKDRSMDRDLKEVVGVLMRVLDGGEVSQTELADLTFDAEGELHVALTDAYIKLLEFAHDHDVRARDEEVDRVARAQLKTYLDRIVEVCDRQSATVSRTTAASY
jgi:predicted transcriptional regulator